MTEEELKSLRKSIKDYGAGCYENGLKNGRRKLEEQLIKAREIINKLINACCAYGATGRATAEAEQFLNSEVEK
jgi:hypothetical protein